LLLATDITGRTVFNVAVKRFSVGVFQGIFNCAEENLTKEQVNKLLLATGNAGRSVFHEAAKSFNKIISGNTELCYKESDKRGGE
jgi:hypothetical protein